MKAKRKLTEQQLEALRKNAAKGRKKLAMMRKMGLPVGKPGPKKDTSKSLKVVAEFPLSAVPAEPPVPAGKRKPVRKKGVEAREAREAVDALAQLIVATWAEVQRRKGVL